ncbi:MAG: hypothetical protein H7328_07925 [Bdellovibrio sp.]|nr:hypothetical protein [Bdellovibrio sp.]
MGKFKELNNDLYNSQIKSLVAVRKFEQTHPDFVELIDVFKGLSFVKNATAVAGELSESFSQIQELNQHQLNLFWPEAV